MSNELKDWLEDRRNEEKKIVDFIREQGFTPLTDSGIAELYWYISEEWYDESENEIPIFFLAWLKRIGLFGRTCRECRFSTHDITHDLYKCYNTEISVEHANHGSFGCNKWEGRYA